MSSVRGATATRPGQAIETCAGYADTRSAFIQVAVLSLANDYFLLEHMPGWRLTRPLFLVRGREAPPPHGMHTSGYIQRSYGCFQSTSLVLFLFVPRAGNRSAAVAGSDARQSLAQLGPLCT